MIIQLRNRNFYIVFFMDLLLFSAALFSAYLIRFEFALTSGNFDQMADLLPWFLATKALLFFQNGLYRGMFRYTGITDMWKLAKTTVLAMLIIMSGMLVTHHFEGFSRAVFLLDAILTFLFIGGFRLSIRYLFNEYQFQQQNGYHRHWFNEYSGSQVVIYGAGSTGEKILRELNENPRLQYNVVGFIDEEKTKWGKSIHSIPIMGGIKEIPRIKERYNIKEILIAAPSTTGDQMRAIVDTCKASGIAFKTMPGMAELIDGKTSFTTLRKVHYRDLLRRKPVVLESDKISDYLNQKVVMVTGAGGSIGSELCRQIIQFQPRKIIMFDASEPSLYNIQMELKHRVGYQDYITILGQVQDKNLVNKVMGIYKPHVVFHAAAYKHVPMLEQNPWQAVSNNIQGCQILLENTLKHKVEHFVMVSTDKAVRPTNIMGTSKRICELLVRAYCGNGTRMMSVRFGNVVGSAGSVIPLFQEQIKRGGPVTVTHPEVTRFFMTIPEASQLILQAGAQGEGGEIFILEMGTSIKIADLALDLIRLSGKEPETDIKITYTGLRQGEKLFEELITDDEGVSPTHHEKIMVLHPNGDWNGFGNQEGFRSYLLTHLEQLYDAAGNHDVCAIRQKMNEIVPEFTPQDNVCALGIGSLN